MSKIEDELEVMIIRQLDGELSPEEELELNKRLIKSPSARALMEEYERNDHLAKMALRAVLSPEEFRPLLQEESSRAASLRMRKVLWGVGSVAAVAASVAIVLVGSRLFQGAGPPVEGPVAPMAKNTIPVEAPMVVAEGSESGGTLKRLERLGPRMPFARTHLTNRRVQRYLVPVILGNQDDPDVLPVWQIERRQEKIRMASGDL